MENGPFQSLSLLTPKMDKFRLRKRMYQTDEQRNSRLRTSHSHHFNKDELVSGDQYKINQPLIRKEQIRLYGSKQRTEPIQRNEEEDLETIKKQAKLLERELLERSNKTKVKYKLRKKNHGQIRKYTHSVTLPEQPIKDNPLVQSRLLRESRRMHSLWKQPDIVPVKESKKKLYKLKPKIKKFIEDTEQEEKFSPPLTNFQIKRYSTQSPKTSKHPIHVRRIMRSNQRYRSFRRAVNAVLFTIKLRSFNLRMRKKRLKIFRNFVSYQLNAKLLALKNKLIQSSRPFVLTIIDNQNFSYILHEKDEPELRREKINSVIKLLNIELKCLQKCINQIKQQKQFDQTFYLLCKHGNYSCIEQINTSEEMDVACVSQLFGYMRSDKNLQKSALISLIFIKILLYNVILKPQNIEVFVNKSVNPQMVYNNIKLIGTIFYELFIQIQDKMFQDTPSIYYFGNWNLLKGKFDFKISESMTVKEGFYQKNQLISGLASHNYIRGVYKTKELRAQKQKLQEMIRMLHQIIVKYHLQFRKQSFIM